MISLHENCQQYVDRRLSEGWKIVLQRGNYLILSSPDGNILRPVDLRNDVETLRPNAAGDETNIEYEQPPEEIHYTLVDEAESDEDGTYVYHSNNAWSRDLYNIADHVVGSGTINKITVYARCKHLDTLDQTTLKIAIKSGTTIDESDEKNTTTDWANYFNEWATNPENAHAWTWDEIDSLQIGVNLRRPYVIVSYWIRCTQVYVEVDYVSITPKTSSDTGSGADTKASGNPLATFPVRAESGGGVDSHKAVAPQSVGETGTGVDAILNFLASLTKADSGVGADTILNYLATLVKADSGSGVEHILDRDLVLTEVGLGVDTVLALLGKLVTESGTGVENSYLHILEGVRDSSDSGEGAEASSLAAILQRGETGEGVEQVIARALFSREPQMGAIDLARVITAAITGTGETGSGAEASLVSFYQKKDDSGSGVDASTLAAIFTGEDSGVGAEAITLLAAMVAHDTGVSVESVLSFFRKLIDSGQGAENLLLVGFVGRRMRMAVYQKEAFNLKVYTSEVGQ